MAAARLATAQAPAWHAHTLLPQPTPHLLGSVAFSGPRAMAVGELGTVIVSGDSGATWTSAPTAGAQALRGVTFVNATTAVAVGANGTLFRSTTAGDSWSTMMSGTNAELRAVAFADGTTGIAVGEGGTIIRSIDGGVRWQRVAVATDALLRTVVFASRAIVIAAGDNGVVLQSRDGGATWHARTSGTRAALRAASFLDEKTGVAVGGDDRRWRAAAVILRTADGGATWSNIDVPEPIRLYGVTTTLSNGGGFIAVGDSGLVLHSKNAGRTWSREKVSAPPVWLSSVASPGGQLLTAVGARGIVMRSEDGGGTWTSQRRGPTLNAVTLVAASATTFVVPHAQGLLRSVDRGKTFTRPKLPEKTRALIGAAFADSLHGIAVGAIGQILRTDDGGATWLKSDSLTRRNLRTAAFADSRTAVAIGAFNPRGNGYDNGPALFRTTDGGTTWLPLEGTRAPLLDIQFLGASLGIAVGAAGVVARSTDAGKTWTRLVQDETRTMLSGLALLDPSTWIVIGLDGTILRTRDAGTRWSRIPSGATERLSAISFADATHGMAVGYSNTILVTDDGGVTWRSQSLDLAVHLLGVRMVNTTTAYVTGSAGEVIRLDLASVTSTATRRGGFR